MAGLLRGKRQEILRCGNSSSSMDRRKMPAVEKTKFWKKQFRAKHAKLAKENQ
jgi:hypothetical protein